MAAYGGVAGSTLLRAGSAHAAALAPGAGAGALFLLVALLFDGRALGLALFLGGGTYVGWVAAFHPGVDPAVPVMAVLLLLCAELAAWSGDERWRMRVEQRLTWHRAGALGLLGVGSLALSALAVALTAAPSAHGLPWTILGAIAATAAAGIGIALVRR